MGSTQNEAKLKKELDEARQRGDLPPEMNASTGTLVNPHVPDFMAKAPWYLTQQQQPTLDHQRKSGNAPVDQSINALESYYRRGTVINKANTYRKGACKNCGSLTHTEKDCLDRPRKIGAWKNGQNIQADEMVLPSLSLGYDAKRDRYAGYDAGEHRLTIAKYEAAEEERKRIVEETKTKENERKREEKLRKKEEKRTQKLAKQLAKQQQQTIDEDAATASEAESTDSSNSSSTDYSDNDGDEDRQGAGNPSIEDSTKEKGGNAKMSTWNVRVREDTAKYLLNLDTESAFYDPKTRSMRENPLPDKILGKDTVYAGDNAWKASGLAVQLAQEQLFAWEASEKGQTNDIHLQGNPTQTALLKKQVEERKAAIAELKKQKLLKEYGNSNTNSIAPMITTDNGNHTSNNVTAIASSLLRSSTTTGSTTTLLQEENLPEELRYGVTESYAEYGKDGKILTTNIPSVSLSSSSSSSLSSSSSSSLAPGKTNGKSKYPEDIYPGNHRSIFGSWFDLENKQWGYACCHNTLFNSYCTGQAGIVAFEKAKQHQLQYTSSSSSSAAAAASSATTITAEDIVKYQISHNTTGSIGKTGEGGGGTGNHKRPREQEENDEGNYNKKTYGEYDEKDDD